ncbi:MAG: hypothetical protein WBL63_24530 [Candidatus Acidiferrum sp.]
MLEQDGLRAAREAGNIFAVSLVVFFEEKLDKKRNVLKTFGERRDADLDGAEPVEKIFAETAGQDFGPEVSVGGGNEADVMLAGEIVPSEIGLLDKKISVFIPARHFDAIVICTQESLHNEHGHLCPKKSSFQARRTPPADCKQKRQYWDGK